MSFQIETERLILRDVREDDIPILCNFFAESEARKNILSYQADDNYNKKTLKNAIAWAQVAEREYYVLSVVLKTHNILIGSCNINCVRPESIETNIGWHYGNKYKGNGYATEAARQLLHIGFELRNVNEIYADCFEKNFASIKIMQKIGMISHWDLSLFNIIRGWSYGEHKPTVRHIITKHQWLTSNESNHKE